MAGNLGELVQMITALSGVKAQRRQLELQEQQMAQQASQFAQQGEEAKFASALKLIAGSSAKTREGLQGLLDTLAPEHREAAMAALQGQPIDPTVTHAADIQQGHAAMSPQQLAMVQNEAATGNATGMNVGGLMQSQLGGVLAGGAAQQVTPQMAQAYAERAATGRDPITAAVQAQQMASGAVPFMAQVQAGQRMAAPQAANVALGYAGIAQQDRGLNFNYAQLDQREREMAANYGLDKMLKTAEAMKYTSGAGGAGGLTGAAWLDGMQKLPNILNDINKNTSDTAGNLARIRVYNSLNQALGSPVPMLPLVGEGAPGKLGLLDQMRNWAVGGPKLGNYTAEGAWPTMTPTTGGPR